MLYLAITYLNLEKMDVLNNLKTFVAVARSGGFSEAARQLHVVPSVVAKRISQLESTMGARLFERTTRSMELTEAGQQLHSAATGLLADFDAVLQSVKRDESKLEGHIRIMTPTTLTLVYLGEVLNNFLLQHDHITMEIALVDRSSNPLELGFDMAISGRTAIYEGVIDIPLCAVNPVLCAAPAYIERRGAPSHPRELVEHNCLVFTPAGTNWQFQNERGAISVDVPARLTADDNYTLLRAAKSGLGIATLPTYVAKEALSLGQLAPLLPAYPLQETWFKAYVPRRKHGLARIQALIKWISANLDQNKMH